MSKKIFTGVVTSNKMNKTIVVTVETVKAHPMYDKKMKTTKKFLVHSDNQVAEGSVVSFQESKPFSKHVSFEVLEVIKEAK